jgi:hypothetical protein
MADLLKANFPVPLIVDALTEMANEGNEAAFALLSAVQGFAQSAAELKEAFRMRELRQAIRDFLVDLKEVQDDLRLQAQRLLSRAVGAAAGPESTRFEELGIQIALEAQQRAAERRVPIQEVWQGGGPLIPGPHLLVRQAPAAEAIQTFGEIGQGFPELQEAIRNATSEEERRYLLEQLRDRRMDRVGEMIEAGRLPTPESFEQVSDAVNEWIQANLDVFAAQISLIEKEKQVAERQLAAQDELVRFYTDAMRQLADVRFTVRELRGERVGEERIVGAREELLDLLPEALAGDTEAFSRIQQLMNELIQAAQNVFPPGSVGFDELLTFVDSVARQLEGFAALERATAAEEVARLTGVIDGLNQELLEIAEAVEAFNAAVDEVIAGLNAWLDVIGAPAAGQAQHGAVARAGQPFIVGERGPELFVPRTAGAIVPEVEGRQFGGPVDPKQPFIVGEKGPELFVPKVAGTIVPNVQPRQFGGQVEPEQPYMVGERGPESFVPHVTVPARPPSQQTISNDVRVEMPVTLHVTGGANPKKTANEVAEALRARLAPRLKSEIQRALR